MVTLHARFVTLVPMATMPFSFTTHPYPPKIASNTNNNVNRNVIFGVIFVMFFPSAVDVVRATGACGSNATYL